MKKHKFKMICVCCDCVITLEADDPEHFCRSHHICPECGCTLNIATWTTEHWHA